jgi:hypothetical protein
MTMTDLDTKLRKVDRVTAPDLWDDIGTRTRSLPEGGDKLPTPPTPSGQRIAAAVVAFAVFAAAAVFVLRAFGDDARPVGDPVTTDVVEAGLEPVMEAHRKVESLLHRLWIEQAVADELEGEVRAAQRDLQTILDGIGGGEPTEEQAAQLEELAASMARFSEGGSEARASAQALRMRVDDLRKELDQLVEETDAALFPRMVTVTCTGDGEGGTRVSAPAVLLQGDGVDLRIVNLISNEPVFLDVGAGRDPVEIPAGTTVEHTVGDPPATLEVVCTYATPKPSWRRPAHLVAVLDPPD